MTDYRGVDMDKASNALSAHAVDPHRDPEILRGRRYTEAIHAGWRVDAEEWVGVAVHAVMALADAEQAELRESVRTYHDRAMDSEAAEAGWQERAERAEAKVERVEAMLSAIEEAHRLDNERRIAGAAPEPKTGRVFQSIPTVTCRNIRAALDGDA